MSDPILDGIQKYAPNFIDLKYPDQVMLPLGTGEYVLFSDLPALLEQARANERDKAMDLIPEIGKYGQEQYEQGQRDALAGAVQRVEARRDEVLIMVAPGDERALVVSVYDDAVATIKGSVGKV